MNNIKPWLRKAYTEAIFRANFYSWMARRGEPLPGGDPVSGKPRSSQRFTAWGREFGQEGRAAYKAMARFWLQKAREIRLKPQA